MTVLIGGNAAAVAQDAPASPNEQEAEATDARPPSQAAVPARIKNPFPGLAPAPSLQGGTAWLNSSGEIELADLRGKIVLLDFWTYCCINCIHVLPDLKYLEKKYANQLVVIGVHSHKFENEKETQNIRKAILRYEIEHPVVNDSNKVISAKYATQIWPTLVVVDPEGQYVGRVEGEGNRDRLDKVIGDMVAFHRQHGTLKESPTSFELERSKVEAGPLRFPGKVLADEAGGRLFIADSNHNRIVVASLGGELLDVIGTGKVGKKDGAYAEAEFDHPQGMALHGHTLYVADTENHLLRTVDLTNKTVSTLAGVGEQARRRRSRGNLLETPLNSPWALSIHEDVLYIAMAGPHQLWSHRLGTDKIAVFAGNGREDIADGPRLSAALAQPSGITHDGHALYWVDSEGSAVRRMPLKGANHVTTIAGPHDVRNALFQFGDVDGKGAQVRLQHPLGIVHHNGMLYVADTYNHKIKQVDASSGMTTTWLGDRASGDSLDPVRLAEPGGVSVAGGTLYIADTNNHRILAAELDSRDVREIVIRGLHPPN